MKKKSVILLCLVFSCFVIRSQTNDIIYEWAKNCSSGLAGSYSIETDLQNNSIVTGYFQGSTDFDPSASTATLVSSGSFDAFVAKYDLNGNYQWAFKIGSGGDDQAMGIAVDELGNSFVAGRYWGMVDFDPSAATFNLGGGGLFMAKYSPAGTLVWAKSIGGIYDPQLKEGKNIRLDKNKNIILGGFFYNTVDFDPSSGVASLSSVTGSYSDAFIAKYDSLGNYIWAKSFGASQDDNIASIALDQDNNIIAAGYYKDSVDFDLSSGIFTMTGGPFGSGFLAKYDSAGNFNWAGDIKTGGFLNRLETDSSNNILMTGVYSGTTDFDFSAGTATLGGAGLRGYLAKYSESGSYSWAICSGDNMVVPRGIAIDGMGNSYITGDFTDTSDFDPSAGVAMLTPIVYASPDIFIAKYNSNGNYLVAKSMGGSAFEYARGIALDTDDNLIISGDFQGTCDFDPSSAIANVTPIGGYNLYVAKYSQTFESNGFSEQTNPGDIVSVYPNPVSDFLSVKNFSNNHMITKVAIYDFLGKLVFELPVKNNEVQINVKNLPSGLYMLEIADDKSSYFRKVVKQ